MSRAGQLDIITQLSPIFRVGAMSDDCLGPLHGAFATQISHALFGNDNLHRMFAMVQMAHQRDNGADFNSFGGGRAGEYG